MERETGIEGETEIERGTEIERKTGIERETGIESEGGEGQRRRRMDLERKWLLYPHRQGIPSHSALRKPSEYAPCASQ